MALFGKKKNNVESVPQEVREYYAAEKRDRAGMAWLMAIGTLVVTLLLAAGLFFGGRWAYRTITKKDAPKTTSQETQSDAGKEVGTNAQPENTQGQTSSTSTDTPSPAPQQTSQPAATPAPAPSAPSTPAGQPAALTNTGPEDTLAIVAVVIVAGTAAHYVWSRRTA